MGRVNESSEPRTRQSCESCRRKKIKCTAERPICSFCERLSQSCVYLPREQPKTDGDSDRVTKRIPPDRVRRLEAEVSNIYHLLHSLKGGNAESSHDAGSITDDYCQTRNATSDLWEPPMESFQEPPTFDPSRPDLPPEILDHLVDVYREKIHLQPLPLFKLDGLRGRLETWPQYLLKSFLALTVSFSHHEFFKGRVLEAVKLYSSAAEVVMRIAADGNPKLKVLQSLSLLAFKDIKARKFEQAWMTIGTAARLASLRQTITDRLSDHGDSADAVARCLWSIVVLEKTFPVHVQSLTTIIDKLPFDFPSSVSFPAPANSTRNERQSPYFARAEGAVQDHGISVYWLDRVSQWGDVSVYLREIHAGKVETPWSSQSTYASLIMKLHEFESKFPRKHLMSNVSLSTRSPTEIGETREYWLPWTTMQIASHAIPALLNHPFIHIVAMHPSQGGAPSRLFLQQTVDQAIFHAGWVCRLIHTMECLKVEHQDPFIGQMVAATATIPLFFQFAQDRKVAQRAVEDLAKCERYLTRLSTEWPHIAQKLATLRSLHSFAKRLPGNTVGSTIVTFPGSLLWDLLDPQLSREGKMPSSSSEMATQAAEVGDASIGIATQFTHPLVEDRDQTEHPSVSDDIPVSMDTFSPQFQDFENMLIDDFMPQLTPEELSWFPPAQL